MNDASGKVITFERKQGIYKLPAKLSVRGGPVTELLMLVEEGERGEVDKPVTKSAPQLPTAEEAHPRSTRPTEGGRAFAQHTNSPF